jgi:hypothetical protein
VANSLDTTLGAGTRVAQWLFAAMFALFCFGSWMDSNREGVDRSHVSTWIVCWIAFFVRVLTIEFATASIVNELAPRPGSKAPLKTQSVDEESGLETRA